jgi:hypothetical protein
MITEKIKALFQFIDYLHSNIENFKQYDEVLNELHLLGKERDKVRAKKTFNDKLRYDEVQAELVGKLETITQSVAQPLKAKATELEICSFHGNGQSLHVGEGDVEELKRTFDKDDLPTIFDTKRKYIDFRKRTHSTYYSLDFFFRELDELLKYLSDFFKENEDDEFESFTEKPMQADNLLHAAELLENGHNNVNIPYSSFSSEGQSTKSIDDTNGLTPVDRSDEIFIECLKLPVFARVEFLESEQGKSSFSKKTFVKILYDRWKKYKTIVFKSDLEKPFEELVKEKGWEYAAIKIYGDEPEPFDHIYSESEINEIETGSMFENTNLNGFNWLNESVLWLLREYLYKLSDKWSLTALNENEPPPVVKEESLRSDNETNETEESELSQKVKKHFGFFNRNCPRKHKKVLRDSDFSKLITWTVEFFENDFVVPEISEPISIVNTNKTYVQLAFRYLFKQLHSSSPYPDSLFTLYTSVFKSYEMDRKGNFDAVKNNDVVKKLMLIEY